MLGAKTNILSGRGFSVTKTKDMQEVGVIADTLLINV